MNTQDHKQALPPGFLLGSYRVACVLGAGGFGVTSGRSSDFGFRVARTLGP